MKNLDDLNISKEERSKIVRENEEVIGIALDVYDNNVKSNKSEVLSKLDELHKEIKKKNKK